MRGIDFVREAPRALLRDRLRVALTVAGIGVGTFAVATLVSLGATIKAAIGSSLDGLGDALVVVTPEHGVGGPPGGRVAALSRLFEDDLVAVRRLASVREASAVVTWRAIVVADGQSAATTCIGVDAAYLDVAGVALADGTPFGDEAERGAPVAILGPTPWRRLFGSEPALGRPMTIDGHRVRIQGVARERGQGPGGVDEDDFVLVPKRFARQQLVAQDSATAVDAIFALARPDPGLDAAVADIGAELGHRRHLARIEDAVSVSSLKALMSASLQAADLLTAMLAGIGSISVLVGGVGIVNVMLANVAEQRMEIGLKLALGASPRLVACEFLAQAVLLALAGAVAGLALAELLAALVRSGHWLEVRVTLPAASLACGLALGVGIAAGALPAGRAARLDPTENLRNA